MAMTAAAEFRGLGRWLALVAAVLGLGLASLFVARRFLDSWPRGLDGAELLLLTQVLVGSVLCFRFLWRKRQPSSDLLAKDVGLHLAATVAAMLLAAAVSSAESPLWAVIVLWMALTCAETWFWMSVLPTVLGRPRLQPGVVSPPSRTNGREAVPSETVLQDALGRESVPAGDVVEDDELPVEPDADESFPSDCLQQFRRFRDEQGAEAIHGLLRAELAPGQRVHHLHVAFCPPLPAAPEFTVEQVDGPEATLTASQVESYGARIDIRLTSSARQGESVVVEFYAHDGASVP
jgi:hypothetical protein